VERANVKTGGSVLVTGGAGFIGSHNAVGTFARSNVERFEENCRRGCVSSMTDLAAGNPDG